MKIEKKILPKYFEAVLNGKKNFELRLADFDVKEVDRLVLREWNAKVKSYTGRQVEKEVTFVIKTKDIKFWNQEEIDKFGFQILSLK
jgi:hypothetical protein